SLKLARIQQQHISGQMETGGETKLSYTGRGSLRGHFDPDSIRSVPGASRSVRNRGQIVLINRLLYPIAEDRGLRIAARASGEHDVPEAISNEHLQYRRKSARRHRDPSDKASIAEPERTDICRREVTASVLLPWTVGHECEFNMIRARRRREQASAQEQMTEI